MDPPTSGLALASFNVHAGVDGWGRPWDVTGAVRSLEADVVVLQEVWSPPEGPTMAESIGSELGYEVFEHVLAHGRRAGPHPAADHRWMASLGWRSDANALYLDSRRPPARWVVRSDRFGGAPRGSWGVAVLSRLPVTSRRVVALAPLRRDRTDRAALVVTVDVGGRDLTVIGTHMSHLTHGSPLHFARLRRALDEPTATGASVLAGDMNLWGPPVALLLPGWRRVVAGKTWPAWRPHSQIDHVLVKGPVVASDSVVFPDHGSDHLAVRVRLTLR